MRPLFVPLVPLVLVVAAAPALAQVPRSSVQVDAATDRVEDPQIATAGNLSAAAFVDVAAGTGANRVMVATSDGRGIAWSAPVQVDQDPSGTRKDLVSSSVVVHEGVIHVAWGDLRAGASEGFGEVYYARSLDGGQTWSSEVPLDDKVPAGVGTVRDFEMVVSQGAAFTRVWVMMAVDPDSSSNEDVYVVFSGDGGATWSSANYASNSTPGQFDVDEIGIAADVDVAFVAWHEDRNGNDDVFFRRAVLLGGAQPSLVFITELRIDDTSSNVPDAEGDLDVLVRGSTVAVLFQEEPTGSGSEELRMNVSTTTGFSFAGDVRVGPMLPGDVDSPTGAILADGTIVVAWDDDRSGVDEVFATRSTNTGASFAPEQQLSAGGGNDPSLAALGSDVAIGWEAGLAAPHSLAAALSTDGGATWGAPIATLADTTGDADPPSLAFDATYRNVLASWQADGSGRNHQFVGGFRPQTLVPQGFVAGPTSASFALARLDPAVDDLVLVILSAGAGPTPIGGGRVIDLAFDALALASIDQAAFLLAPVGPDGSAQTPPAAITFPPGLSFRAAALGIQLAPTGLRTLTDARTIAIP